MLEVGSENLRIKVKCDLKRVSETGSIGG